MLRDFQNQQLTVVKYRRSITLKVGTYARKNSGNLRLNETTQHPSSAKHLARYTNRQKYYLSHLMRLWHLSHRRPAKAQMSLRIRAVSPEPSLFAYMKYGRRRRVLPKIRHLAPLDGCACAFEECVYGGRKVP